MTGRELIRGSLELIGAIGIQETPSAEEQSRALSSLNVMLSGWSIKGVVVFARLRELLTLTGASSYTMGPSGSLNTSRPVDIYRAALEDQSSNPKLEIPLRIFTPDEYAAIPQKSLSSTFPTGIFIDWTNPLITIYPWPIPTIANKIALYSKKPLSTISDLSADLALPPGYERAIMYNLALERAPAYGKTPSDDVRVVASDSFGDIQRANLKIEPVGVDPFLVGAGGFDPQTGEPV